MQKVRSVLDRRMDGVGRLDVDSIRSLDSLIVDSFDVGSGSGDDSSDLVMNNGLVNLFMMFMIGMGDVLLQARSAEV